MRPRQDTFSLLHYFVFASNNVFRGGRDFGEGVRRSSAQLRARASPNRCDAALRQLRLRRESERISLVCELQGDERRWRSCFAP
eukprot:6130219-Pyramimonas_sp.AAC.1